MILLIDNYDSFTYNLAHLFGALGCEVKVVRNDAIDADMAADLIPSHLLISPGPGRPGEAGATLEIVRGRAPHIPALGVCPRHPAPVEALRGRGGAAQPALPPEAGPRPRHGRGAVPGRPPGVVDGPRP